MLSVPRYRQIWKTAFLPVVDFFSLFAGAWVAYLIRYNWLGEDGQLFSSRDQLPFVDYSITVSVLALIVVAFYGMMGLYQISRRKNLWQIGFSLAIGIALVLLSLITFFFFNEFNPNTLPEGVPVSRFILASVGFFTFYFVLLGRAAVWSVEQFLYYFNIGKIQIAVIGDQNHFLEDNFQKKSHIKKIYTFKSLSSDNFQFLKEQIETRKIAEIYLFASKKSELDKKLALHAERYKVSFIFSPQGFSDFQSFGLKPVFINKKVFLELVHTKLDGWQVVLKRLFDLIFAILFLICFSWLYLLLAILIKLDSEGPIFYLSERVSPNGNVFKVWKFRRLKSEFCTSERDKKSLKIEQELIAKKDMRGDGVLYKIKNDPRSTRIGRFLEKSSLDELPQFFNVLKGEMSLVGPRPHQPREVAKYRDEHYKVLNISPGLTGLAQVNGRSDLNFDDEVKYDIYYVENWSFWLDLWIIIKTPFTLFFKRHN